MAAETLADVADIVMGQSPPGNTVSLEQGEGLPLLNGPTEFGPHHPSPVQFTYDTRKRSLQGDILFCVRGSTTGRMNWSDQEYAIGRGVAAIRHSGDSGLQHFVKAVIEYWLPELLAQATGSTFPNVSASQLAAIPYPSLPVTEQRAIAHILGTLDDKIELNQRMNETLEAMAQALFKSWFVDFDPVRAETEGRDPGLPKSIADLFPDRFEESELGEIPKGWGVGGVSNLGFLSRDGLKPIEFSYEVFDHYSIPAYDNQRKPNPELGEAIKSNKLLVLPDCVLLSKLNPRIPRVWLPTLHASRRSICSTEFLVVIPKPGLSREFLYCIFTSDAFMNKFATLVTGTSGSHQRVKPEALLNLDIVLPPLPLVERFTSVVSSFLSRVADGRIESHTLVTLRDTLLPRLISGGLRVKNTERFLEDVI